MQKVYLINYNVKGENTAKTIVFAESTMSAAIAFYEDWLNGYNKSVAEGESLVCSPDELEHITIEPLCIASDVVGR